MGMILFAQDRKKIVEDGEERKEVRKEQGRLKEEEMR